MSSGKSPVAASDTQHIQNMIGAFNNYYELSSARIEENNENSSAHFAEALTFSQSQAAGLGSTIRVPTKGSAMTSAVNINGNMPLLPALETG